MDYDTMTIESLAHDCFKRSGYSINRLDLISRIEHLVTKPNFLNREEIREYLTDNEFIFNEMDSRMNYGLIGNLCTENDTLVTIFPTTFYIEDNKFPVNLDNLKLIQSIQYEFRELTRDKNNKITTWV